MAALIEQHEDELRLASIDHLDEATGELLCRPAVGLLLEGPAFWAELFRHPDRYEDRIFQTVRRGTGKSRNPNFTHTPTGQAITFPIPPEAMIDRNQILNEWSDTDAQRRWVEQLPADWVPYIVSNPFAPGYNGGR